MRFQNVIHLVCLLIAWSLVGADAGDSGYRAEIHRWREDYEAGLRTDNGWLTLAGLFWLKDGENRFGAGAGNDMVLPEGSAADSAGEFVFHDGKTLLRVKREVPVLVNGEPTHGDTALQADSSGKPDRVTLGRLSMMVIRRGNRYGIRLWDNGPSARRAFGGLNWFPVNKTLRITARFTAYPRGKKIPILNILGDTEQTPSAGYAAFELAGKRCHLEAVLEGERLFFILKDLTSGKETYPAGRFLYADLPKDGKVVIDFNKAYNPPCAFTNFATCPLPPRQNHLPVAVRAGALKYERVVAGDK